MKINGPYSLTGELQRDYNFEVLFYKNPLETPGDVPEVLEGLFSNASLAYLSGLVKKITSPNESIKTLDLDFNLLGAVPIPRNVELRDTIVTFMEDDFGFVTKFFRALLSYMMRNRKLVFRTLSYCTIGMILSKTTNSGIGVGSNNIIKVPNSVEVYPHLLPYLVDGGDLDKSSDGLMQVSVSFKRIPRVVTDPLSRR